MAQETETPQTAPRDAPYWASQTDAAHLSAIPAGARNLNVEGKRVVGPLQGFGPMWQKTYRVRLVGSNATPQDLIRTWKENFPKFWPKGNHFYAPLTGINPGEVALINSSVGGAPLSTGVMVLYADDESFTLMTTQGHPFSGWVTFSALSEDCTIAQAQVLMRANDPMYAVGMRLFGGHRQEDKLWQHTLQALATELGVTAEVSTECVCVDPRPQWGRAKNIWHNAAIRSSMHLFASPFLAVKRSIRDSR